MAEITVLDGGMGQELVRRSGDAPTPLWSTQVMIDHPGLVTDIHRDFFAAGASIATTNSYAVLPDRLEGTPLEGQVRDLQARAVAAARAARTGHAAGRIAGAIGPLGASYRPDLHPDSATAVAAFRDIAQGLVGHCDLLLFETVASVSHARDALAATVDLGHPVWIALTLDDSDGTRLRSGEPVTAAVPVIEEGGAAAVLLNCAPPEAIQAGLPALARGALPFGAYANGFERISEGFLDARPTVDALAARRDLTPERYAAYALDWVDAGATIVGGCCEVGPAHIAEVTRRLSAAGHTLV